MKARAFGPLVLAAATLAAWPVFVHSQTMQPYAGPAPVWTSAPVKADYRERDALVATYEADARRDPGDQIVAQLLASQYLARYRERVDIGDLQRAQRQAERSLALQPHFNYNAEMQLATVMTAFHRMHEALEHANEAARIVPSATAPRATLASLDMEVGDYAGARRELAARALSHDDEWAIAQARFDELTGRTAAARALLEGVQHRMDSMYDNPAEARAWTHWREGDLAFAVGDIAAAQARYREALAIFPGYWHAYNGLARSYWSTQDWPAALDAAKHAADAYPLPETLGFEYDARIGLRDREGAAQTLGLIEAIDRLGNAAGISDRLLAMFYADHHIRSDEAIRIARRDLARRDDIYSEDTLAWALAAAGRWHEARPHALRAVRLGTADSRLQYHAGVIALHAGASGEARWRLRWALAINPRFHPAQADDARQLLEAGTKTGPEP